jgi:hypothetical protein
MCGSGRLVVNGVSAGCDSGRTLEALLELSLSYGYHDLVEHVGQHSVGRINNKVNETWTVATAFISHFDYYYWLAAFDCCNIHSQYMFSTLKLRQYYASTLILICNFTLSCKQRS